MRKNELFKYNSSLLHSIKVRWKGFPLVSKATLYFQVAKAKLIYMHPGRVAGQLSYNYIVSIRQSRAGGAQREKD